MYAYKVSIVLEYSPFFELTYFSNIYFEIGSIVEVSFLRKKMLAIILSVEDLIKAKQELKKADFKTQKILTNSNDINKIKENIFKQINTFAQNNFISVGEFLFYLFDKEILENTKSIIDDLNNQNFIKTKDIKNKITFNKIAHEEKKSFYKNLSLEANKKEDQKNKETLYIIVFADDISLLSFKEYLKNTNSNFSKNVLSLKPKEAIKKIIENNSKESGDKNKKQIEIFIDDFRFENFLNVAKPHISQIKALIFLFSIFNKDFNNITFLSKSFGALEGDFIKENNFEIEEILKEVSAKKYFVNIDRNDKNYFKNKSELIQKEVLEKIVEKVEAGKKIFIFNLNHGFVQRIYCNDCNTPYSCHSCKTPYSLNINENQNFLSCKVCKEERVLNENQLLLCSSCGGFNFQVWGAGIEKVYDYLKNKIEVPIYKFDEYNLKIKDKELFLKIQDIQNSETGSVSIGSIRALKAANNVFDMTLVLSFGNINEKIFNNFENLKNIIDSVEDKSNEMYVQRIINQSDNKTEKFFDNYKVKENKENISNFEKKIVISISFLAKEKAKAINLDKFFTRSGEYKKKNNFVFYYILDFKDIIMAENIVRSARGFADVAVAEFVRDFVFAK